MNSKHALEILRHAESALRARGVMRAALFGSVARGDNRPDSDIDVMIEIDPAANLGIYEYIDIKEYVTRLFDTPVDVVARENLKPHLRGRATADAIYAF